MFVIEDELHSEWVGEYKTLEEVIGELKRLASIPWGQEPNRAPCTTGLNCGRNYEIIEYDTSIEPWNELNRNPVLDVSAKGVQWHVPKL